MGRKNSSPCNINTPNSSFCKTEINAKKNLQNGTHLQKFKLKTICAEIEEYYRTLRLYKDEFYHMGVQSSFKFTVFMEKDPRYFILCVKKVNESPSLLLALNITTHVMVNNEQDKYPRWLPARVCKWRQNKAESWIISLNSHQKKRKKKIMQLNSLAVKPCGVYCRIMRVFSTRKHKSQWERERESMQA